LKLVAVFLELRTSLSFCGNTPSHLTNHGLLFYKRHYAENYEETCTWVFHPPDGMKDVALSLKLIDFRKEATYLLSKGEIILPDGKFSSH